MNVEVCVGRTEQHTTIFVSVTDEGGKPIDDLAAADIGVHAIEGGLEVAVAGVAARGDGVYALPVTLAPLLASWPRGEHVLLVRVRRVFDRGQSLAVLTIP